MDVLVSSGEGVGREQDTRVTIYKKTEETYQLKLKASRMFYSEVTHKHGLMPFNLRTFEDEKKAKMAVVECVNHRLIEPFQVNYVYIITEFLSKNLIMLTVIFLFLFLSSIIKYFSFKNRCYTRSRLSTQRSSSLQSY